MNRKRLKIKFIALFIIFLIAACGLAFGGGLYLAYRNLPQVESLREYRPSLVTRIYSDDNKIVGEYFIEKRVLVPYKAIPVYLKEAVISVEDDAFYIHKGLDYKGIIRAFWVNLISLDIKQGGSTITHQLARSLFLTPEQTILRKVKEAILARRIENILSKDQILEISLTQIYLGRGPYGVQCASQIYLGKDVKYLTLSESALLAGIIRSPALYSPYLHPDRAKMRQKFVMKRMVDEGYITDDEYKNGYKQDIYLKNLKGKKI